MNKNRIDRWIGIVIELFTSKTIIIVIMVLFMGGIINHLFEIFDSWLLAIGAQATVLLLSVNAKYLPSIKSKSGADIPVLALLVSVCISYLLYMNLQSKDQGEFLSSVWWLTIVKSVFISALELSYSFLFVARTKDSDFEIDKIINEQVQENKDSVLLKRTNEHLYKIDKIDHLNSSTILKLVGLDYEQIEDMTTSDLFMQICMTADDHKLGVQEYIKVLHSEFYPETKVHPHAKDVTENIATIHSAKGEGIEVFTKPELINTIDSRDSEDPEFVQ